MNAPMSLTRPIATVLITLGLFASAIASEVEKKPLRKGERIVFFGDSITAGGAGPNGFITMIRSSLEKKYPELKIECLGAGVSGNRVPDLQERVDKDVVAKNPTIVVIYIGINDVWRGQTDPARGTAPDRFTAGLEEVVSKVQAGGARVILCTPTVIGEKKHGGNSPDVKLDQYADLSRSLAKQRNLQLCDLRKAFVDYIALHNPEDKEKGILTSDQVHLNLAGNQFVAEKMLGALEP